MFRAGSLASSFFRRVPDLSILLLLFGTGFALVYKQNLQFGPEHPVGWDTVGYIQALYSFIASPISTSASSPLRVGYTIVEFLFGEAFRLDPFQSEAYFPVILAALIAPMLYLLVSSYTSSKAAGALAGVFGLVWFQTLRMPRDIHSNLMWIVLVLATLSALSALTKASGRRRRYLSYVILLLMSFSLIEYPVEVIIFVVFLLSAYFLYVQSHFSNTVDAPFLRDSAHQALKFVLLPTLILGSFWGIGDVVTHGELFSTLMSFVSEGVTLQPLQGAGTQVLDPHSQYFIVTFPWLGNYVPQANSVTAAAIAVSVFTYLGVLVVARFATRGSAQQRMISWVLLAWYAVSLVAVFSTSLGIFYPFDRAELNLVDPPFTAVGIWWLVTLIATRFRPFGSLFSVRSSNPKITVSVVCLLIGLGVFSQALPSKLQYADSINSFFTPQVRQEVGSAIHWSTENGSSREPIFLIDYSHATPDYLILYESVISAFFANETSITPLFYYGSLRYLLAMSYTPSPSESEAESSAYTAGVILTQAKGNVSNFNVFLLSAFYAVGVVEGSYTKDISAGVYVLDRNLPIGSIYGGRIDVSDFVSNSGWYDVNDNSGAYGIGLESSSNGQVPNDSQLPQRTFAEYLASNYEYKMTIGFFDYAANNGPMEVRLDGTSLANLTQKGLGEVRNFSTTFRPNFTGLHNLTLTFDDANEPYMFRVLSLSLYPILDDPTNSCSYSKPLQLVPTSGAYFGAEGALGAGQVVQSGRDSLISLAFQWLGPSAINITRVVFGNYTAQEALAATSQFDVPFEASAVQQPVLVTSSSKSGTSGMIQLTAHGPNATETTSLHEGQYDIPFSIYAMSASNCGETVSTGYLRVTVSSPTSFAALTPTSVFFATIILFLALSVVFLRREDVKVPAPSSKGPSS